MICRLTLVKPKITMYLVDYKIDSVGVNKIFNEKLKIQKRSNKQLSHYFRGSIINVNDNEKQKAVT